MLLDICTGREPRTFTGEIYEELGILGGLVLIALLSLANHVSDVETFIVVAIIFTFALVYGLRIFVVQRGLRAPTHRLTGKDASQKTTRLFGESDTASHPRCAASRSSPKKES